MLLRSSWPSMSLHYECIDSRRTVGLEMYTEESYVLSPQQRLFYLRLFYLPSLWPPCMYGICIVLGEAQRAKALCRLAFRVGQTWW